MTNTPCHNDLNPGNLLFLGTEFKAIDYESAAQNYPYGDIAEVAIFYCFTPSHENVLLTTYLGRKPSAQEQGCLYMMKQIAWINYALLFLKIDFEKIHLYGAMHVPGYQGFLNEMFEGKIDFENSEHRIMLLQMLKHRNLRIRLIF